MQRPDVRDEGGVTLVELLIYMMLAVVVLTIVGAILINSFRTQAQVQDGAQSASTAQLVAESIGQGVRNASALEVTNPSPDSTMLRTRSIDGSASGNWICQAWVWSSGELRTARSSTAIGAPDTATFSTWALLATGVSAVGSTPIFSASADERSLSVTLTVANGETVPILIDSVMVAQQPVPATGKVTAPCF